jgi:hypothetical protein
MRAFLGFKCSLWRVWLVPWRLHRRLQALRQQRVTLPPASGVEKPR